MNIHSSAWVDSSVRIPQSASIGPGSIVEAGVEIAPHCQIGARCHVYTGSILEEGVQLFDGCIVGSRPQDLKYQGEPSEIRVGKESVLREYVTVNGGTLASGKTTIGSNCLIMAYTHVAHDCVVGNNVILANGIQMGGHVSIGDHTVVSGMTGIHQFSVIGMGCFVAGGRVVDKNILPFSKALGEPLTWAGINTQGLEKWMGLQYASLLKKWYREAQSKEELLNTIQKWTPEQTGNTKKGQQENLKELILDVLNQSKRGLLSPWIRRH